MTTPSQWFETAEKIPGAWETEPEFSSFGRLWRVFMTARVATAGVLVVLQAVIHALGSSSNRWPVAVCIA